MRADKNNIIIGVTGSFGTGKTTVAKIFKDFGASVLDADKIAHQALKKDTVAYNRAVREFGKCILRKSGQIDRVKLARLVFRNKKSLNILCNIVHPVVLGRIKESIKKVSNSKKFSLVVIDAPLLIEAGLHNVVDYLIVVKTSRQTQIKRLTRKTGLSTDEIIRRIKCQMPLEEKIKIADYIIDNEGRTGDTRKIVKQTWKEITKEARSKLTS